MKTPADHLNGPRGGNPKPIGEIMPRLLERIFLEKKWRANPERYALKGDRNWYYNVYLQSTHWRNLRAEKIREVGYRCEGCQTAYDVWEPGQSLDVHHKTYERLGFELLEDLEVLCRECHLTRHRDYEYQNLELEVR